MKNQFIQLTMAHDKNAIVINTYQIAWAQAAEDGGTDIHMAIARGKDLFPKRIKVDESFDIVMRMLLL